MAFALFRREAPDPTSFKVEHGGVVFEVALRRRPQARRMTLRISRVSGEAVVTCPPGIDAKTVARFVAAQGGWIAARKARMPQPVTFENRAVLPLRGVPHRIVQAGARGATRTGLDEAGEPVLLVSGDAAFTARRVREYLYGQARRDLVEAVGRHTAALGVSCSRITVRDTRSRWGSCSSRGALNFSWRLILAPPLVLDYLAAHEVAHLRELNHQPGFWRLVHGLCPRTDEAERWLKRHGADLHRYG